MHGLSTLELANIRWHFTSQAAAVNEEDHSVKAEQELDIHLK